MTMSKFCLVLTVCSMLFMGAAIASEQTAAGELRLQVEAAERAFAETMVQRDFAGFVAFLADETIFFSGETPLRGKQTVAAAWKPFYEQAEAPFSWQPEHVEVLDSGKLALSSGPVFDPQGKRVATFNSVWRLEADGKWRVIFDKGCDACNCAKPETE